ncbi:uridylate-specific endoribonuclease-like [Paramacrobiotus metropolitanus]|uniref:uridylate-specific endoribonuclease-like n=1 Tax=Paramacrobiotus metropolitanus TaxID=2943436 RepID=UPI002445A55E|nr:uridylate-specific endoribonuclease-like [Paramacrobiotus metropolitanus]
MSIFPLLGGALVFVFFCFSTRGVDAVDPDLLTFSEELYRLDQQGNAAAINQHWAVNTRSTNGKLFTKVEQSVFQKPTYKALIALFDNYNPVLGQAEEVTAQEKQEETAFLDAIMATPVMQKAFEYLSKKNLVPATKDKFKDFLRMIWFTIYRRRGQPDTSGFEHTFVGEINGTSPSDSVEGFHNWVMFTREETAGRAKYGRWKGQADPDLYGMQFTWNGHTKIKSTIAIGESPEMSIAVLTTCFVVAPNGECSLRMGGAPVKVLTYKWDVRGNPNEFYVASAYYDN